MKQIYRFNRVSPPLLSEKTLRAEIERRRTLQHTAILAVAGILVNWCFVIAAFLLYPVNELLSIACLAYALVSIFCGGAIAAVYTTKGGTV